MAGRIEVAQGYVTIVPSLKGARARLEGELVPAATSAGKAAGSAMEKGISDGAAKGAKEAGQKVQDAIPKAGDAAGKDAGEKVAKGIREPVTKASDQVAKDVQSKLGKAFSGMGDKLKGMGGSIGGALSGVKGFWGDALADVGGQVKSSKLGQAFSGIADGAKSAFASVTGTAKGVAGFVGTAFSTAAKGVGTALGRVGAVASTAFSAVKGTVSTVVGHISSAFEGVASAIANGPIVKVAGVVGSALSTAVRGVAVGAAAAGTALVAVGKSAFDSYKDYEQLVGGMDTLFGDASNQMQIYAYDAFATAQMSANDYMELSTSFAASLLQSLDGDTSAAADAANRAVIDMADNANKMGTSMEDIENAYKGFSKQNFTMLDNLKLGYGGTKEEMQRLLKDAEAISGVEYDIDSFADITEAIHVVQEEMGIAGTSAEEAAHTISGSTEMMKSAWQNWVTGLARDDAHMDVLTSNLTTSIEAFASNVIPRVATIAGNALAQLPGLVAAVGPQLGQALLTIVDEATGGLGTKALEMLQPVTDALTGAFEGVSSWVSENAGPLGELGDKFGELGGKVSEFVGGAITTVGPVVEGIANGALAALPTVLDLAGAAFDAAGGLVGHFGDAISPLTDVLGPVADAVGGTVLDAFDKLAGVLEGIDWDGWSQGVKDALQGVVDFVSERIEEVKGFFQSVGEFIDDPIGSIQNGLGNLVGASYGADAALESNFSNMANGVQVSTSSMVGSIGNVNSTKLNNKTATFTANGNVIGGDPAGKVRNVNSAAAGLTSKSVDYSATGNITSSTTVADRIWGVVNAVGSMRSKSIEVTTNYRSTGSTAQPKAAGAIVRRFAEGAIFTKPTLTDVGLVGEDGAEAMYSNGRDTGIFPLTNRRFTGPFASEIASQVAGMTERRGDAIVFNVRSTDPGAVVDEMTRRLRLMGLAS